MSLIREFSLFAVGAALMLSLTIAGVLGVAEIHIWALAPDSGWHTRREGMRVKDSLELEIADAIYERDTTKSANWDSLLIRRSSFWRE